MRLWDLKLVIYWFSLLCWHPSNAFYSPCSEQRSPSLRNISQGGNPICQRRSGWSLVEQLALLGLRRKAHIHFKRQHWRNRTCSRFVSAILCQSRHPFRLPWFHGEVLTAPHGPLCLLALQEFTEWPAVALGCTSSSHLLSSSSLWPQFWTSSWDSLRRPGLPRG